MDQDRVDLWVQQFSTNEGFDAAACVESACQRYQLDPAQAPVEEIDRAPEGSKLAVIRQWLSTASKPEKPPVQGLRVRSLGQDLEVQLNPGVVAAEVMLHLQAAGVSGVLCEGDRELGWEDLVQSNVLRLLTKPCAVVLSETWAPRILAQSDQWLDNVGEVRLSVLSDLIVKALMKLRRLQGMVAVLPHCCEAGNWEKLRQYLNRAALSKLELNLRGNGLVGSKNTFCDYLGTRLVDLVLDLGENRITGDLHEWGRSFGRCDQLSRLEIDLSGSMIGDNLAGFGAEIGNCRRLTHFSLNLQQNNVSGNLSGFGRGIAQCSQLMSLRLNFTGNQITGDLRKFAGSIGRCRKLSQVHLSMADNDISGDLRGLGWGIHRCEHIAGLTVNLRGNEIGGDLAFFGAFVSQLPKLGVLEVDLQGNRIASDLSQFGAGVGQQQSITKLRVNLQGNRITGNLRAFADGVSRCRHLCGLEVNLRGTGVKAEDADKALGGMACRLPKHAFVLVSDASY
mmetsp:Transcript_91505/g.245051  ORF Transcript_91505/g.245051 Transcript_91505/m.245051 type:complete len:508 (+) Transcript_91505:2-1525(+)